MSSQDYTTALKRRILAQTFINNPPAPQHRTNAVVLSVEANMASAIERKMVPIFPYVRQLRSDCCVGRNGTTRRPGSSI